MHELFTEIISGIIFYFYIESIKHKRDWLFEEWGYVFFIVFFSVILYPSESVIMTSFDFLKKLEACKHVAIRLLCYVLGMFSGVGFDYFLKHDTYLWHKKVTKCFHSSHPFKAVVSFIFYVYTHPFLTS